jgi:hypothetical protein
MLERSLGCPAQAPVRGEGCWNLCDAVVSCGERHPFLASPPERLFCTLWHISYVMCGVSMMVCRFLHTPGILVEVDSLLLSVLHTPVPLPC